jgi:hypothetical protein
MKMSAPNRESIMKMAKDLVSVKPDAVNPFANENSWQYKAWAAGAAMAPMVRKINETKEFDGAIYKVAEVRTKIQNDLANGPVRPTWLLPRPVAEHIHCLIAEAAKCNDPMRAGRLKHKVSLLTSRHATI